MDFTSGEIRGFVDAVRGEPERGDCVVRGTVTRVDPDGTAWVQIGQNAEPTPCQRDMACHVGDSVTVRIADHQATVTGNASAPATDDHEAKVARGVAEVAQASAEEAHEAADGAQRTAMTAATNARAAETAAQEARQAAEAVNQHFWDDTRGAHVTEATQEDYLEQPSGFQNLMTSLGNISTKAVNGVEHILRSDTASGMVVYDGECAPDAQDLEDHVVAAFTKDGAQIGRKGNAHMEMDFNSFKMVDKNGYEFFVADDLRDEMGVATITETFAGNGTTKDFTVMLVPDAYVSATDSSHEGAAYTTSYRVVRFEVAPDDGATVTIVYKTSSQVAKAYTLGRRMPRSLVGPMSVAEGLYTTASGIGSHAEGGRTIASGNYSHAEGNATTASDQYSHAEGWSTTASDRASHAEGVGTTAHGQDSHAEGNSTTAFGDCSHAEGDHTSASGYGSHAEGDHTTAGVNSHAEGSYTTASGSSSHAEGRDTTVSGDRSHAEGDHTIASSDRQHVEGKYNVEDTNNQYAHIIGNGTSDSNRSNAYTVDWDGNVDAAGTITGASVGDANGTLADLRDSVSQLLTTRSVRATITANNDHVAITAPAVSGYTFLCWVGVATNGWVNWSYIEHYNKASTNIWTTKVDRQRAFDAFALYVKSV